jgi:predicted MFS family arabinose efflux permease
MNSPRRFVGGCYVVEGVNSFATVIFFNYLYFFFRDRYGFSDRQNLTLAAVIGFIYVISSWQAGRFAQKFGNFTALKIGFTIMSAGLAAGLAVQTWMAPAMVLQIGLACLVNFGMCFIWPVLEALVSEGANPARAVGIYNMTWAIANAVAFFIGGTLIKFFGYASMFYVPLVLTILQLGTVFWLEKIYWVKTVPHGQSLPPEPDRPAPAMAKKFQSMAWLANPFAYIAINTLIAVLPGIAAKFHLSPMEAGFMCSLWCFARVAAFFTLWKWTGWHYRFRWLVGAFALLIISFAVILVAPSRAAILIGQIFFGVAIGLIYYSSLFYAMDASETKSEHGGIHEAAIGVGNCLGPAAGAAALWYAPQSPSIGAWAVSGLLALGLGGLVWLRGKPGGR